MQNFELERCKILQYPDCKQYVNIFIQNTDKTNIFL